ncbi:putative DNA-directed RNA polymerase [Helianthus anomalus]
MIYSQPFHSIYNQGLLRNTRCAILRTVKDSSSTKAWLEKMKTLFISKGSWFSSRSVITGDPYTGVGDIAIPHEIT